MFDIVNELPVMEVSHVGFLEDTLSVSSHEQPSVDTLQLKLEDVVVCSDVRDECVFNPPVSERGREVEIFSSCIEGTCTCDNLIGDRKSWN